MKQHERQAKWQRVVDTYKRLITTDRSSRVGLTDRQYDFVVAVNKKCVGRVYMHQPSDYIINKLYNMTINLPT